MADRIEGYLEIGHNEQGEVVINLPQGMTGHIKFSPDQARALAHKLIHRAGDAESERRKAEEAKRIASLPPVDRSARVLTDGNAVTPDHLEINPQTGQQKGYVVLSAEERAKGFIRPVRRSYVHKVCGTVTTMGVSIAETCARDPGFYSGTFCCGCEKHFPLDQFVWDDETGLQVGS